MRPLNDVPARRRSISRVIAASIRAFGPRHLSHRPAVFAIVVGGLLTGLLGAGDLISDGPAPFALLEMSFTLWGFAFVANVIDALFGATDVDVTGRR